MELRKLEADNIRAALRVADGKVCGPGGAADLLGVKSTTLASRIKTLGLWHRSQESYDPGRKSIGSGILSDHERCEPGGPISRLEDATDR